MNTKEEKWDKFIKRFDKVLNDTDTVFSSLNETWEFYKYLTNKVRWADAEIKAFEKLGVHDTSKVVKAKTLKYLLNIFTDYLTK